MCRHQTTEQNEDQPCQLRWRRWRRNKSREPTGKPTYWQCEQHAATGLEPALTSQNCQDQGGDGIFWRHQKVRNAVINRPQAGRDEMRLT
jgi:hypothetical protein